MKRKKITLLMILFGAVILFPAEANSQNILNKLGKKVQDKISNKVEERVDEKVDEEVDKSLDKVLEGDSANKPVSEEERQQERMGKFMKGLGMSGEPVPVDNAYSFDSKIQMHIESYKGNGEKESDGDFITYVSPSMKNFAYEFVSGDIGTKGKGIFIMDLKNKAMIILSEEDGKKTGIVYGFDISELNTADYDAYEDLNEESIENINLNPYLKKTGRTKTIEGYKCEEYKYDNPEEDTEATFWMSKEVNMATRDWMSSIFKSAAYSHGMPWGFIMESEAINKETKERNIMKVTDIDQNANKKFDLSGYQITNLGSMKIPNVNQE
ncbi:MAG: DUF4412 domain-containing protein [Mangrovibacterium sp.]